MVAQLWNNRAGLQIPADLLQDPRSQPLLYTAIGLYGIVGDLTHTYEFNCHWSNNDSQTSVAYSSSPFGYLKNTSS